MLQFPTTKKYHNPYNSFVPMVDKTVDAAWSKQVQIAKFSVTKGTHFADIILIIYRWIDRYKMLKGLLEIIPA